MPYYGYNAPLTSPQFGTGMEFGGGAYVPPELAYGRPAAASGTPAAASGNPTVTTPTTTTGTTSTTDATDWEGITKRIDELNRQQQQISLAGRIPGGADLEKISSGNIAGELRGEVPGDVKYLLAQQAAERGAAGGFGPGAFTNASYLRALGLTSLGLRAQGQADLTAAEGRNPAAPLFDPSKMIITPYEQAILNQRQQELQLQNERLALGYAPSYRSGLATPGFGTGYDPLPWTFGSDATARTSSPAGNYGDYLLPAYAGTGTTGGSSVAPMGDTGEPFYDEYTGLFV